MTNTTPSTRKRILIAEDHPMFRSMVRQLIEQLDMEVCAETDNIQDALALVRQQLPDGLVLDLTLSGSSGLELLKSLRAHDIELPVLVLSMHAESLYAERVLRAGAKGYVSKEASPETVSEAIRTVMAGDMYVSQQVAATIFQRLGKADKAVEESGVDLLSDRELEVFQLIGQGLNSRAMAEKLNLGASTVDSYRARIKDKLGIKNAAELYQRAAQWLSQAER